MYPHRILIPVCPITHVHTLVLVLAHQLQPWLPCLTTRPVTGMSAAASHDCLVSRPYRNEHGVVDGSRGWGVWRGGSLLLKPHATCTQGYGNLAAKCRQGLRKASYHNKSDAIP